MRNLEGEHARGERGWNGQQHPEEHRDYPATLAPNVAAMLSYLLFGWVGGLIMYLTQKNREVRFHAAQSILTFGGLTVIWVGIDICFSLMFIYTGLFLVGVSWLVSLLSFVLWIFLSIQGYQLKHTKLPIIGAIAERWAANAA